MANWIKHGSAWAAALALAACGGGGGGGTPAVPTETPGTPTGPVVITPEPGPVTPTVPPPTEPTFPAPPAPPVPPTPPAPSPAGVLVQGVVRFESIGTAADGGLDYKVRSAKPARGVRVQITDLAGQPLVSGVTDALGHYALRVPSGQMVKLKSESVMAQPGDPAGLTAVEVADNTSGYLYGVEWSPFLTGTTDVVFNGFIPSGWDTQAGATVTAGSRLAAPYAILDTVYESQSKVLSALPATVFPPLTIFWSTANTWSDQIDWSTGEIGSPGFLMVDKNPVIVLAGKADVDTDEYDASVISHEWAHYFQSVFSRNDSMGGAHSVGDLLDRNLAFSEGLGDAWSGIATGRSTYSDSLGAAQASGLLIDLATPPSGATGWFSEESIAYVLWQLNAVSGVKPLLDTLTGPFRTTVASTGIHSFNAGLASVSAAASTSFAALLESQQIASKADAWGNGETNAGGSSTALPMTGTLTINTTIVGACVSTLSDTYSTGNKLGEWAYFRFHVPTAGSYQIHVGGRSGSNPEFTVVGSTGTLLRTYGTATTSETATIALPVGDYILGVTDSNLSSSSCLSVGVTPS